MQKVAEEGARPRQTGSGASGRGQGLGARDPHRVGRCEGNPESGAGGTARSEVMEVRRSRQEHQLPWSVENTAAAPGFSFTSTAIRAAAIQRVSFSCGNKLLSTSRGCWSFWCPVHALFLRWVPQSLPRAPLWQLQDSHRTSSAASSGSAGTLITVHGGPWEVEGSLCKHVTV